MAREAAPSTPPRRGPRHAGGETRVEAAAAEPVLTTLVEGRRPIGRSAVSASPGSLTAVLSDRSAPVVSSTTVIGPCCRDEGVRGWMAKFFTSLRLGCGTKFGSAATSMVCAWNQFAVVKVATAAMRVTVCTPVGSAGRRFSAVSSSVLSLVALVPRIKAILKSPDPLTLQETVGEPTTAVGTRQPVARRVKADLPGEDAVAIQPLQLHRVRAARR